MHAPPFVPRPFPPPALAGVPLEYIVDQLHALAPRYWNRPASADCTLSESAALRTAPTDPAVIPIPHAYAPPLPLATLPPSRRATAPAAAPAPRLTLHLHTDYLAAQSVLLRALFAGAHPLALAAPAPVPADRRPRLLPCAPAHPVLFLPLPDPASAPLLIHWLYFGDTRPLAAALARGAVAWEGAARNVEYLGLPRALRVFLGRWYARWLAPARARYQDAGADDDGATDVGDSDSDPAASERGSASDAGSSTVEDDAADPADAPDAKARGRPRTTTRLLAAALAARTLGP